MQDPRTRNLAKVLVRYSVRARAGDQVGINGTSLAEPLILAIYEEVLRAGAFPAVRMLPAAATEIFFAAGRPAHFTTLTPYQRAYATCMDASINIQSEANTRGLSAASPAHQVQMAKTTKPVRAILMKKRWVGTLYPTPAYAQDAEMSLRDFEDFAYAAMFADQPSPVSAWNALERCQAKLIGRLRRADEIRLVGPGTDLRLSVKGRTFINSCGEHNVPSGEVFTGPVEDSAEGHIAFDYPVCVNGREIDGIRLVFRQGLVVEATAEKNGKYLTAMLDSDPGARRLGELGIGTNTFIQRFIRNILFDEKIGGTIHLALGQSYAETGGRNQSAIHWDMIKDLRRGGAVYVDGKLFEKDGRFV